MILSAALFVASLTLTLSNAKYVTEIGGGETDYETQMPAVISSQQDLHNAITSGYEYVELSPDIEESIIMTGDSLNLKNDLTIDLNGGEITRNDRISILNVPEGKTLTIVDSGKNSTGGFYNPIGSVLTVSGGKMNVYGGKFESGPRPAEYYGKLSESAKSEIVVNDVSMLNGDGTVSGGGRMPLLRVNGKGGNVYFDVDFPENTTTPIRRDTYCFAAVSKGAKNEFASINVSGANYSYKYRLQAHPDGTYTYLNDASTAPTSDDTLDVMIFAYEKDIETSMTLGGGKYPEYAAVSMNGGELNVTVDASPVSASGERTASEAGSFYSYFGTWHTYCILMDGGVMNVNTSGKFETVSPALLPALAAGETRNNSAKYAENACILCAKGTLNINKIALAQSYNGSAISVSGGTVNMGDTFITKDVTLSHSDDPFFADPEGSDEFPERRQYRDAALFVNGGTLNLDKTVVTVTKNISSVYPMDSFENVSVRPQTSFGILSRGRTMSENGEFVGQSSLIGNDLKLDMHGDYSYGIYATRGEVKLTGSENQSAAPLNEIVLNSDVSTYGVYAINKVTGDNAAKISLKNYKIRLGKEETYIDTDPRGLVNGRRAASVGVYLDSSQNTGGSVTLDKTEIHSQEMGVAVDNGTLTFLNGGTIHAYNSSAVVLRGGDIVFDPAVESADTNLINDYDIICNLNRQAAPSDQCNVWDTNHQGNGTKAATHQYDIYVPWQVGKDGTASALYENTNAVRVIGGSLNATGAARLNIAFCGLYNDYDMYDAAGSPDDDIYFDNILIKSFAVACTEESGRTANVTLKHADITSSVGGGIKVAGGTITLGDETSGENDIIVNTTGNQHFRQLSYVAEDHKNMESQGDTTFNAWKFYPNLGGGHAVVARNGRIDVFNGKYTAKYGNGVTATGEGTVVNIYGGVFNGNLQHDPSATCVDTKSGPASHYGVNVMGAATVHIKGGTFDGRNGGLLVRGKDKNTFADVFVYEGKFGAYGNGQDGVVVMEYSNVRFGAYSEAELKNKGYLGATETESAKLRDLIYVEAALFPISVNKIDGSKIINTTYSHNVTINVYYGYYKSKDTVNARGYGHIDEVMNNVSFAIYGDTKNTLLEAKTSDAKPFDGTKIRCWTPGNNLNRSCSPNPVYYL